ncbi:MAG: hypothetical protein RLZZ618_1630 [Pseudomonadota bacterium]
MLLVVVALGVGSWYGWRWWKARPQPVEVTLSVDNPAISSFTENSVPQPAKVTFSDSVAPLAAVGKTIDKGIRMSPEMAGTWRWVDDRHLAFDPKAEWPVGAEFKVEMDSTVLAPQVRIETREFKFSTAAFTAKIQKAEFYQDPSEPTGKRGEIQVRFSHPINTAEFEKRVELRMDGQAEGLLGVGRETTPFTVTYDKYKLHAYIHSANLPIPKEDTNLTVAIDKGVVSQLGGAGTDEVLKRSLSVPGQFGLSVNEVRTQVVTNERFEPEQVLMISTSQLVHEREFAKNVSVWLLPEQNPAIKKEEQGEGFFAWSSSQEVTEAVLAKSTKLAITAVPSEEEYATVHAFKVKGDVGRSLFVRIQPKAKSFGGYSMRGVAQAVAMLNPYPPELRILSQGALLPMSGEKKLAVLVRDLPGLKIELGRVQPSQLHHLVSQSRGNFASPDFLGSFGADNLTDRFERSVPLPGLPHGKAHYESIDLSDYLAKDGELRRGLFFLNISGYDPKAEARAKERAAAAAAEPSEPSHDEGEGMSEGEGEGEGMGEGDMGDGSNVDPTSMRERRLVLVTDLGIVVKKSADGSRDVFVQSLFNGLPVAGATVDVVARNGSALFSQVTDAQGKVHFDKLEGLTRERTPLLVTVRKAGDMSFMPLDRQDRVLDVSRFDVGGLQNARTADQLTAYLFSDRGIYRPGESMHIGMIVKAADWTKSLAGLPLEAEVLDSRGLTVKRERIRLLAGGFTELNHTTLDSAPTGNYTINLNIVKDDKVERQIGSTTVKVQEFLPDRMKVTAQLSAVSAGWVHPKDLKGLINAQNLFGTPAENRRVEVSMDLNPAWVSFRGHLDYSFRDPQQAKEGFVDTLPEGKTDAKGLAEFDLKLSRFTKATYQLSLLAKVFEPEGGRSVSAETVALVSDQPFMVGVKHDGDPSYVSMGSKRVSHIIAIDPQAKATAVKDLSLQLIERKTVSMLIRQPNDTYRYESRLKEVTINEPVPLAFVAAGHSLTLDTRKAGNYSYLIADAQGVLLNRIDYSVAGQGNVSRSLERNAELQLSLNKKDYAPGEEIEISIRAPYVGAGLITIEREKVFTQQWFKTTTTASVQKIRLPKDFEGNGYVSVQFVRDPSSDEIFMSPLSHGVVPFVTSLAARTQKLTLAVPELVKPGQVLKMNVTAAQPTRVVVFAIDEGILQVARYSTADPLAHFFQKRALEVRTSQILDLLLPEFKRLMAQSAPGGDGAGANARFLNPFKRKGEAPAVYWSGIVDVKDSREFSYTVPDHFNGKLRVMAVAVNEGSVGVEEKDTTVRGDFVLSPNLPLAVSPGDQFDVSVGVSNNVNGSPADAPVQLTLKPASSFELVGPATQTLKISFQREGVATYRLKVKDAAAVKLGSATLEFSSSLGPKSATRRMDISVRPASARATTVALGQFTGSHEQPVPRDLVPEFRKQELAMSVIPLAMAPGLMNYLDNFPHQCTEQLVSRAFPGVVLAKRPEFGLGTPQSAAKGFDEALRVLRSRQNAQGGFGLWGATVEADEFASVYAVHLLLESRDMQVPGLVVPPDMLRKGLEYLQQLAASNPADMTAARSRAYAIYLLTRNGAVTTPLVSTLRETLDAKFPKQWQNDSLAGYLAATYQLLKQDKPANELIGSLVSQLEKESRPYAWATYYDPIVHNGQTLYLLARHFPSKLKSLSPEVMNRYTGQLAKGSFNTLSSAYTVLAFEAMAETLGADALGKLTAVQFDAKNAATPLALPANMMPRAPVLPGTVKLRLANEGKLTTYYSVSQSGFDRVPATTEIKAGMEIVREYVGADGKPVTQVKVGDEVMVKINLRAIASGSAGAHVPSVALTDLLPGGFEPVVSRDTNGVADSVNGPMLDYADVREDRVVIYTTATGTVQTYKYKLRATNTGEFTVPPSQAESMYERDKFARSVAGRITVTATK